MKTGIYRNRKNGKPYLVLFEAVHSETRERLIVYVPQYESYEGVVARPKALFEEKFEFIRETTP